MSVVPLVERARSLWLTLAGAQVAFGCPPGVVAAPASRLCPPQWTGVVSIGGTAIVTTPSARLTALVGEAVAGFPAAGVVDEEQWRAAFTVTDVLGPTTLSYLDPVSFRRRDRSLAESGIVQRLPARHPAVAALLDAVPAAEAEECGIAAIDSPAFVVRHGTDVAAVAGYVRWPGDAAHLCVLTAPGHRGRGHGQIVAAAATADALAGGLLPQWRARVPASRGIARALGFSALGTQLSLRIVT